MSDKAKLGFWAVAAHCHRPGWPTESLFSSLVRADSQEHALGLMLRALKDECPAREGHLPPTILTAGPVPVAEMATHLRALGYVVKPPLGGRKEEAT